MIETEDQAREWIGSLVGRDTGVLFKFERFAALLQEENCRQNLVSTNSLDHVWVRHFADSVQLLRGVPRGTTKWLDLGSGAGLPGVAIAIARPTINVTCVESRRLRVDFLQRLVDNLDLENCDIVQARVQNLEINQYGVISARAFAPLPKLLEISTRFSSPDTLWRLPKGRSAAQELSELQGWKHLFHVEQSLTDANAGIISGRLIGRTKGKNT